MAKQPEINLDALMQGEAPGVQPWIEEEEETISSSALQSNKDEEIKYPSLRQEVYSKDDINKLMDEYNQFIDVTPSGEDKDKFNAEFEQTVIGGTKDVEDFASGLLSAEPDALDAMEDYINFFGKEYINNKYALTPAAQKALARIKDLRQQATNNAAKTLAPKEDDVKEELKKEAEKTNLAKIKEISKKKPQDISLQDYLLLKQAIEENPRKTPEQKAKDIESLTSKARIRMQDPSNIKEEELSVVPVFITAFGYDKDKAINKEAMRFRDAIAKRNKPEENNVTNEQGEPNISPADKNLKTKKPEKKSFFEKTKDWGKRNWKKIAAIAAIVAGALLLRGCPSEQKDEDNNRKEDKKTIVTPAPTPAKTVKDSIDIGMTMQYAKRIGHQENLNPEAAAKRTVKDLAAFQKLPNEMKAKFAGKSDEEKLARLGVVRGDQDKLHKPIDDLLAGEKINPITLKDISERSFKVTNDFGAHKDNSLKNGKQSIQMSAYEIQKAFQEKGSVGK